MGFSSGFFSSNTSTISQEQINAAVSSSIDGNIDQVVSSSISSSIQNTIQPLILNSLTASNIANFTQDVREQFTAGENITIVNGVISAQTGGGSVYSYTVEFNAAPSQPTAGQLVFSNNVVRFNQVDILGVNRSFAIFNLIGETAVLDAGPVVIPRSVTIILEKRDKTAYAASTFLQLSNCTVQYYTSGVNKIIEISSGPQLGWQGDELGGSGFWKPQTSNPQPGTFTIESFT